MVSVKRLSLILVILFGAGACSTPASPAEPTPTFTPWVAGTETALASLSPTPWITETETALAALTPTPWVAGTETAIAVANASPTPAALPTLPPTLTFTPYAPDPGMFSPVLYGKGPFLILGGFKRDQGWLTAEQAAQWMSNSMNYELHGSSGLVQVVGTPPQYDPICREYFMQSSFELSGPLVGAADGWIKPGRSARDLSTDDSTYVQALAQWFQSQGNSPKQIRITRLLQVDLDGDGVDEVLLSASYFGEKIGSLTETGDYSVVLMRKVAGNTVVTVPLVKDYYVSSGPEFELSYPNTYTLAGALDLNGDGTLEVIVDVSRWEGGGAIVYQVDGQNVREVMRAICGG